MTKTKAEPANEMKGKVMGPKSAGAGKGQKGVQQTPPNFSPQPPLKKHAPGPNQPLGGSPLAPLVIAVLTRNNHPLDLFVFSPSQCSRGRFVSFHSAWLGRQVVSFQQPKFNISTNVIVSQTSRPPDQQPSSPGKLTAAGLMTRWLPDNHKKAHSPTAPSFPHRLAASSSPHATML